MQDKGGRKERFVAWRNALESKGLKVNISKTKVMRCAWDVAPKEAAVDKCSVCGKRVGVNSIYCANVATGCMGDVRECEEVWQEWHKVLCAKCVEVEGDRQLMSFALKIVSLCI